MLLPAFPANPTPNDYFRHFRRMYVLLVGVGTVVMLLAFGLVVKKIGPPFVAVVLVFFGMLLMLLARFVKSGANCPQCSNSLLWKKGRFGTGHASFGEKKYCPVCNLDLNVPWVPAPAAESEPPPSETME